jgi:tRNA G18 (ribose-2'-O)-methylase SpoU
MSKKVKWSIGGVVIVGIAAFMAVTAAKRGNKGTEVRVEAVEKRDLVASVTASGQVQPQMKVDVAADISGAKSYTEIDWHIPRLVVFGSEAHGLDEEDLGKLDERSVIPMEKDVESLNLAVAAGVVLFEARRQNSIR